MVLNFFSVLLLRILIIYNTRMGTNTNGEQSSGSPGRARIFLYVFAVHRVLVRSMAYNLRVYYARKDSRDVKSNYAPGQSGGRFAPLDSNKKRLIENVTDNRALDTKRLQW